MTETPAYEVFAIRYASHADREDVATTVRHVFRDRVRFHAGTETLAPGITLHLVGGRPGGLHTTPWS